MSCSRSRFMQIQYNLPALSYYILSNKDKYPICQRNCRMICVLLCNSHRGRISLHCIWGGIIFTPLQSDKLSFAICGQFGLERASCISTVWILIVMRQGVPCQWLHRWDSHCSVGRIHMVMPQLNCKAHLPFRGPRYTAKCSTESLTNICYCGFPVF